MSHLYSLVRIISFFSSSLMSFLFLLYSPPCKHISLEQLEIDGMKRRSELPRYKKGLVCQQFLTTGHCNLFNKYGRCSLDHPQNLHTIIPPVPRCSQCTLVWPCNHCSYSVSRRELEDALNLLKTKLALLYQIALPAPPIALTSHLVRFIQSHLSMYSTLTQTR
jgi:hypothetical protein